MGNLMKSHGTMMPFALRAQLKSQTRESEAEKDLLRYFRPFSTAEHISEAIKAPGISNVEMSSALASSDSFFSF